MLDSNCFRHPQFLVFRPPLPLLLCSINVVRSPFYHHILNSVLRQTSKLLQTAGAAAAAAAEDEEENGSDGLSNLLQSVVQGAAAERTAAGEDDEENDTNGRSQLPSVATVCGTEELRYRGTRRYSHSHSHSRSFNS